MSPTLFRGAYARRVPPPGKRHANAAPLALAKSSPLLSNQRTHGAGATPVRMANSFAAFGGDGDTQPLETQVYRQYESSIIGRSFATHNAQESQGTAARVDLVSGWDHPDEIGDDKPEEMEDEVSVADGGDMLDLSPVTHSIVKYATSDADKDGFAVPKKGPKTPGLAGSKRDHRGDILYSAGRTSDPQTSSTKTPGTELSAGMFGNGHANNLISMTQAFNQTQAPSSPLPDGLGLEPVFERPSPNFQPPRATSPIPHTSSPTKPNAHFNLVSEPVEFRTNEESQEERRRWRQEDAAHRGLTSDATNDDDLFNVMTSVEKRAARLPRYKNSRRTRGSGQVTASEAQAVQIPMTSSKPGLRAEGLPNIPLSPLSRMSSTAQEVPATASPSDKRSGGLPKATQATAIEDSQKERTESQKENDDPELLADEPVHESHAASQRTNNVLSQFPAGSAQSHKTQKERPSQAADVAERDMPSSPPMMTSDSRDEDEAVGDVAQDQPGTPTNAGGKTASQARVAVQGPSELEQSANNDAATSRPSGSQSENINTNTNTTSLAFQTAPSHQSQSPTKQSATQNTAATGPSPRLLRTRKLTEIAADPTPRPSYEQPDLETINILNDDDRDFARIMSGSSPVRPTRKKRIVYSAKKQQPVAQPLAPKTPPSAKEQNEAAGRGSESPAVEPSSPASSPLQRPPRKVSNTQSRTEMQATSHASGAVGKLKRPNRKVSAKATRPAGDETDVEDGQEDIDEIQAGDVENGANGKQDESDDMEQEESSSEMSVPAGNAADRVIAFCRDGNLEYWPATCTGLNPDGKYAVRFDDGFEDAVLERHIRRYDIRPGDLIKIDLPAMKKREYVVQSIDDTTVTVSAKPSGKGPMAGKATPATPITISIGQIFLNGKLWPQLENRVYTYGDPARNTAPASTPAPMQPPSAVPTPASRSRRAATVNVQIEQSREVSTSSFKNESHLFHGMAFAVSFKDDTSSERKSTIRLLLDNGAQLLDNGFENLFEVPEVATSASDHSNDSEGLQLASKSSSLGFVALITDMYSRTSKYLQALSLGLPCLHHRWVSGCITAKQILPWDRYLLPAGESSWLGGSVRSRTMPTYEAATAKLADIISNRTCLIEPSSSASVLLVEAPIESSNPLKSSGRTKKAAPARGLDKHRNLFVFMMSALGLKTFRRVKDIAEAKTVLGSGEANDWGWVFVDGDTQAAEALLAKNKPSQSLAARGRKRKRVEDEEVDGPKAGVRVVNDEFVIQSLILGALAE